MKCAVKNCETENLSKASEISFFRFPSNPDLLKKWISFCCRNDNFNAKTSSICMNHFRPEDFENKMEYEMGFAKKRFLNRDAVPTIKKQSEKREEISRERSLRIEKRENKKTVELLMKQYEATSVLNEESMVKSCKLCNASENDITLFPAPKDIRERQKWSTATSSKLTKTSLICLKHFRPGDIITGNIPKLKSNAIPTKDVQELSSVGEMLQSHEIKTEPPELVLVNEVNVPEQTNEVNALLEMEVKLEPTEAIDQLSLIHEEQFDAHNGTTTNNVKSSENNIPAVAKKRKTCGLIQLETEEKDESFKLTCIHCDIEFLLSDWSLFIKHFKGAHQAKDNNEPKSSALERPCKKKIFESIDDVDTKTVESTTETNNNSDDDQEGHFSVDEPEDDETYEPKVKRLKKDKDINGSIRKEGNVRKKDDRVLYFGHPQKQCIINFLELIKENAILWHRRQSIMKRFDEALSTIIQKYNNKWPQFEMNEEQARMSIYKIKDLYQRVTDTNHKRHIKNSTHQKNYPAYFKLCDEIEENSRKVVNSCDKCRAFFFTEIDLQIHKVKLHRIGELPFKCKYCKYGFSKAETLAEHEQKHERRKSLICDVCNRSFYNEQKLQAHAATHTNDYNLVCEVCGEIFNSQSKYRRHKLHHEPPKEKCEICGKLYYQKWNLSEHIKSHRNERQYKCDVCGKTFNHQNDVTIHKRGVHNIKPQRRKYIWVDKASTSSGLKSDDSRDMQIEGDCKGDYYSEHDEDTDNDDDDDNASNDKHIKNDEDNLRISSPSTPSETTADLKPRIPFEILIVRDRLSLAELQSSR